MAITVKGVDALYQLLHLAQVQEAQSLVSPSPDGVISGLVVSVATGTRLLSVSAGAAAAPNILAESNAAESVTLAANTSGNPRIDAIVLEIDHAGTMTSAGDVKAVTGTPAASPVAPTLTRTAGVLWQIPLAYVTVANGATQLVAGNISAAQSGTGYQSLTLASGYAHVAANPLAVAKGSGVVEFGGAFRRSGGNVTVGSTVTLCTIPSGFRPRRSQGITAVSDLSGSTTVVGLYINKADGVVELIPITGTINNDDVIRVLTTWLPEV